MIITIKTSDRDLTQEIWKLKTKEVKIIETLRKTEEFLGEITLYIALGAALLPFLTSLLDMIKAK